MIQQGHMHLLAFAVFLLDISLFFLEFPILFPFLRFAQFIRLYHLRFLLSPIKTSETWNHRAKTKAIFAILFAFLLQAWRPGCPVGFSQGTMGLP